MLPPRDSGKPGPGNYITEDDPRWKPGMTPKQRLNGGKTYKTITPKKPYPGGKLKARRGKNSALAAVAARKATPISK